MLKDFQNDNLFRFRTVLRARVGSAIEWSRKHPWRAVVYGLLVILAFEYLSLPNIKLQELETMNPRRTALMLQREREASEIKKPYREQQTWVPLGRISPHLVHAVIVSEDGTFYENGGVDWYEVQESIAKNLEKGKAARGASTISQQLSKNLFLSTSKDPLRKLKELVITLRMERVLSKERILEIYLNVIEWGNGVYGAEAASKKYFGEPASSITREEAARLAAVIPSPLRHQPNQPSEYVDRRASIILERMTARGY